MIDWKKVAEDHGLTYGQFESQLLLAAFAMLAERLEKSTEEGDCIQVNNSGYRMLFIANEKTKQRGE